MASFDTTDAHLSVPSVLADRHRGEAAAFLSADVAVNLFQLCWLDNHGMTAAEQPELFHFSGVRNRAGRLQAVALMVTGRLVLIYAADPAAAAAMGRWYRRARRRLDHVVSGRRSVTPFWRAYAAGSAPGAPRARLDRDQQLYVLDQSDWFDHIYPRRRPNQPPAGVARATSDQLEAVFLASARMHHEETLQNPLDDHPETFRNHVRHRIESRRTYVWFDEHRRLIFKADLSACSSFGVQISGVYTAPQFRGRGLATRALFDICEELFDSDVPRITLYVNAENSAAHRLYKKVGFHFHADYQTVFVESPAE